MSYNGFSGGNYYYEIMIHFGIKGLYVAPRAYITAAAPEGLICTSVNLLIQADEIQNINVANGSDSDDFYFEF